MMRCCGKLLKNFNDLKPWSCRCPFECPEKDKLKIGDANGKVLTSCPHNNEHRLKLLLKSTLGQGCDELEAECGERHSLRRLCPSIEHVVSHDIQAARALGFCPVFCVAEIAASSSPASTAAMTASMVATRLSLPPTAIADLPLSSSNRLLP